MLSPSIFWPRYQLMHFSQNKKDEQNNSETAKAQKTKPKLNPPPQRPTKVDNTQSARKPPPPGKRENSEFVDMFA